ncbi:hypothetical protein CRENBAI_008764 [Crenichthys baileyi]|uniref:Uncharacterized protein n=1 Tax=Crenichthys baileyi TaxID=28760 RepID=A0AAV9RKC0_9TELE
MESSEAGLRLEEGLTVPPTGVSEWVCPNSEAGSFERPGLRGLGPSSTAKTREAGSDHFGRAVRHAQPNRPRSSDVTGIIKPAGHKLSLPFPACLMGRRIGGSYLEREKLAGKLFLHKAIPGRA